MSYVLINVTNTSGAGNQKALRLLEVCTTIEKAKKRAEQHHAIDPSFDLIVGTFNEWFTLDYDPAKVDDVVYDNSELNTIISDFKKQQEAQTNAFNARLEKEKEKANLPKEKPNALTLLSAIVQLEAQISERERELKEIKRLYNSIDYTDEQRHEAEKTQIKPPEISPVFNFS